MPTNSPSPDLFVHLRVEEPGLFPSGPVPLAGAHVTLFELDAPAPAGDDVIIPPLEPVITVARETVTVTTFSYSPVPDQAIATQTTDSGGDVLFIISTAAAGGTPALNDIGGIVTASREEEDFRTETTTLITSARNVLEGKPDFGVTVTDTFGNLRATRRLVALNVTGNQVGSSTSPVIVTVPRLEVNTPGPAS